ncbi:MAG TPA: C40 family peptidase, partial [Longimicrobiaceae bacterium]|nr:C40 family peptidase [Longimicrobiaceae bacterium]
MPRTSVLVPVLLLAPAVLAAQSRTSLSAYTSAGADLSAAHLGGAFGRETDGLGFRVGMGVGAATPAPGAPLPWTVDVDGTAHLGRMLPGMNGTRVFAGFGVGQGSAGGLFLSGSTGAAYAHPLAGPLALEVEGRYRAPFAESEPARVELRAGLTLAFARGGARPVARRAPARASIHLAGEAPASASALAALAIGTGESYLGVPYKWGGNTPQEGFDCSGFLRYVYRAHGVELPRVTRDQAQVGEPVPTRIEELRPGDLMFFAENGTYIDHAAMYVGEGRILHSSASGRGVRYDDLYSQRGEYYRTHFVAARRVLTEAAAWRVGAPG